MWLLQSSEFVGSAKVCPPLSVLKDVGNDKHLRGRDEEVGPTRGLWCGSLNSPDLDTLATFCDPSGIGPHQYRF